MGGEDWALWIKQLAAAGVLNEGVKTVAYSYIGPSLSHAIYRDGTIGGAKKHLEKTAKELHEQLQASLKGETYVSVNKGLVTRSSAVIPIIPLYLSVLFKVMKEQGTHEPFPPTKTTLSASTTGKWTPRSRKKSRSAWPPSPRKTSPR